MSTRATWVLTVVSETTSSSAISALESPRARSLNTSSSRAVSSSRPRGGSAGVGAALANSWIRRRVIDGASSASPSATTRMPATSCSGGTSLSRKPLAPARSASYTYSLRSKVVSISTRTGRSPAAAMMRRVASMPSSSGMRMSMSTTSGSRSLAIVTAWAPSEASPTTSRSSSASRIILNPARTSAWSSAIRMRTVISGVSSAKAERGYPCSVILRPTVEWNPGADLEAAAGARAGVQLAPEDAHALAHADEAVASAAQATGRPGPRPPIADVQREVLSPIGDVHLGRYRGRVLDGVGDRLLDHAIGGVLDALGQRAALALDGQRHRQSGGSRALDQPVEAVERWGRGGLEVQHAEQSPDLGQRVAA